MVEANSTGTLTVQRTNRSAQQVEEIRARFLQEYEANPDDFEHKDAERVRNSDWFVKRFLLARGRNVDAASEMIIKTLKWRRAQEMEIIRDWMFPVEFYKIGGLFAYEKDKQGNVVVYMRTCMHRKISELEEYEKRFLLRVFDKVDRMTAGNGFAIVFDLTGTGYSNVDLEFLRFLFECASYYPVGLKYILVTNLPWILNAVRKTVMVILPEYLLGLIKFASGDQIFDYIDKENVPDFLGGTCRRNYRQIPPESKTIDKLAEEFGFSLQDVQRLMPNFQDLLDKADQLLAQNQYEDKPNFMDVATASQLRDYSFINKLKLQLKRNEISEQEYRRQVDTVYRNFVAIANGEHTDHQEAEQMQPDIITDLSNSNDRTCARARDGSLFSVIKVTPDRLLYLERDYDSDEYVADVCVENNTDGFVAYKVQCNRPQAYTVSPSLGIILPRKTIRFSIRTVNERSEQSSKDKFLVLALPVSAQQMTHEQFKSLWGEHMHQSVESVRLHARILSTDQMSTMRESPMPNINTQHQLNLLLKRCDQLQQIQIKAQQTINILLAIVLFLAFFIVIAAALFAFNQLPVATYLEPYLGYNLNLRSISNLNSTSGISNEPQRNQLLHID